jgi:hypothetical protein
MVGDAIDMSFSVNQHRGPEKFALDGACRKLYHLSHIDCR